MVTESRQRWWLDLEPMVRRVDGGLWFSVLGSNERLLFSRSCLCCRLGFVF
ncbi:hypothetical protein HanRHA438_Chr02g0054321 [Helianthus annuus]|nr:hypothetical protein HanRHA438_Chr02g0054321 [Helianthus annuus]